MKKILQVLAVVLPTTLYILIFQILFPPLYAQFDEVYRADTILVENIDNEQFDIMTPYFDEHYFINVIDAKEIKLTMTGLIYINGNEIETDGSVVIYVSGNNILIETISSPATINGAYNIPEVDANAVTNGVSISIGTIMGLLVLLLAIKTKLPTDIKVMLTLGITTVVVFMLQSILSDMFWVLISVDTGWLLGMGVGKFPSKEATKRKLLIQQIISGTGNV